MQQCKDNIPEESSILFKTAPGKPELYSPLWYRKEYYVQKAPYYLYPRKVLNPRKGNYKEKDFRFIIIFNTRTGSFSLLEKQ